MRTRYVYYFAVRSATHTSRSRRVGNVRAEYRDANRTVPRDRRPRISGNPIKHIGAINATSHPDARSMSALCEYRRKLAKNHERAHERDSGQIGRGVQSELESRCKY